MGASHGDLGGPADLATTTGGAALWRFSVQINRSLTQTADRQCLRVCRPTICFG